MRVLANPTVGVEPGAVRRRGTSRDTGGGDRAKGRARQVEAPHHVSCATRRQTPAPATPKVLKPGVDVVDEERGEMREEVVTAVVAWGPGPYVAVELVRAVGSQPWPAPPGGDAGALRELREVK